MTGVNLIRQERVEQIKKHGFSSEEDDKHINSELMDAAHFALTLKGWPLEWDTKFRDKIAIKSVKDRLIIAGAFIAAELDRRERLNKATSNDDTKSSE